MTKGSNYISGIIDYNSDSVLIWERGNDGRNLVKYPSPFYFYVPDEDGEFTSIFGDTLKRLDFDNSTEFDDAKKRYRNKFESDFSPLDKVLMKNYYNIDVPKLHYTFLDIEVDYKQELGFSNPRNPYAPINAVTVYHQWMNEYITIAVPPKSWKLNEKLTIDEFNKIMTEISTNLIIVNSEYDLLYTLLQVIEDSDVVSGWNSDFFDMPYLVKRTEMVLGKRATNRWCFDGAYSPKYKEVERFGTPEITVRLSGRVHLDYLALFKKFTFEGRTSYSLANIADEELSIPKLDYDGTLEELYNNDFIHFLKYNVRDVEILKKLDDKFNFIALANQMAHSNTVPMEAVLGTVKFVETGIVNYAHNVMNKIVGDKEIRPSHGKVEGAIVMTPKIGLHSWIGACDINSLYPSCIRSLNISPEKIVGQFSAGEEDWRGIWMQDDNNHILILEDQEEFEATGKEWNSILRQKQWSLSAYGTVFDLSNGPGVVAAVLTTWFAERKNLQKQKKEWGNVVKKLNDELKACTDDTLKKELEAQIRNAEEQEAKYDLLQLTMKIQLNSTYGALLNQFFLFFDERMGASVTATGRQITTHMIKTTGEIITGEIYELVKTTEIDEDGKVSHAYSTECPAIIYSDTDSVYFNTFGTCKEEAVEIADTVAEGINDSFQKFMREAFFCTEGFDNLIRAVREIVGMRGLFQAKKKYVIKVVDSEGKAVDKMKSMGSEVKKSDTPKVVQKFLKEVLDKILCGINYPALETFVNEKRRTMFKDNTKDIISLGVAKQVNKLDTFYEEWKRLEATGQKRVNLPGHVRASINYNEYALKEEGKGAKPIKSGDKILIFYLKPNHAGFKSIAIPSDMTRFPKWLTRDFEIDIKLTETKMVDSKLEGIFAAMGYEVPTVQGALLNKILEF